MNVGAVVVVVVYLDEVDVIVENVVEVLVTVVVLVRVVEVVLTTVLMLNLVWCGRYLCAVTIKYEFYCKDYRISIHLH